MDRNDSAYATLNRIWSGLVVMVVATLGGAAGFWWIGDGRWTFGDCVYFTIITLSTVGFGETLEGLDATAGGRPWTVALLILGSGTMIYFASAVTALFVEGDLRGVLRRNQMRRQIDLLHDHVIVCGCGATGRIVMKELADHRQPFVVLERDEARIEEALRQLDHEFLYVLGNAMEDEDLLSAGIGRAKGLIAALTDDRDNLMVTITARALNERARIVAKAIYPESHPKLRRAGATSVVSPNTIGGHRMVIEVLSPSVVQFMDDMARDRDGRRLEDVAVASGDAAIGHVVGWLDLQRHDTLLLAIRKPDGTYRYNPPPTWEMGTGDVLILMGRLDALSELRERIRKG